MSKNLRKEIIQSHHEESLQNHIDATKTFEKIQRNYYFSNMRKQIKELIKKCDLCQRNKYERHKSYEYLHSLKSSNKSRQFISMNFITKLSLSIHSIIEVTYDFILVTMNRLTKSTKFTSFQKSTDTKAFIKIFTKIVIANKEISKEVIFDKNKLFTSKYWDAWTKELDIHVKLSTSYHSKTNEQIERTNQTLEFYLRKFVNYHQTNWIELLSMTQISYNNSINATTQKYYFIRNMNTTQHWINCQKHQRKESHKQFNKLKSSKN